MRWYGLMYGHDGRTWMSCRSARSLICLSVGRSVLCATRRWAMYCVFVAAAVGGLIGCLQ